MLLTAQVNPSTAQTNAALVAATANKSLILRSVYISSDTEMTVSIVNSATHSLLWRQYVGALGGQYVEGSELIRSLLGEGFDYTTSTNGNVFLSIGYVLS